VEAPVSRPLRIAHLATVDATLRFLLLPQLVRLRGEGYEVAAVSAPGPWTSDLEDRGIRHVPWPSATRSWDPAADARAFGELRRTLRRERFDLVHTHNPKPGVLGRVAARWAGVPCVANTVHGLYATRDDPPRRRVPVIAAERLAARFSDLELYQSEEDLAWARELGLVDPPRAVLLGNGTDLSRFDPAAVSPERRAALRRELGFGTDEVVVGTVGRLVAEKGYRELVRASEWVREREPKTRFLAVGPGDPSKSDALGPEELRVAREHVFFTGWRDDVRDLLAAMDVFVLASWREGLPRSGIEAAAMGLPMVLADIRGCREIARHGAEGLLVPRRDPGRLAEAILRLVRNDHERRRMGAAARERAVDRFDERQVVEILLEQYRGLFQRKGLTGSLIQVAELGEVQIRRGRPEDATALALYHARHSSAFLPLLGPGFLRQFYLAQIEDPRAVVVVAERDGQVVGFCTGVASMPRFIRRFALRHGPAALAAAGRRLGSASVIHRAWEVFRYPGKLSGLPDAELVFAAVDPVVRSQRLGGLLTQRCLDGLAALGVRRVRVFIGVDNEPSYRMIRRLGFQPRGQVVVHQGTESNVLVTSLAEPPSGARHIVA
jgi:glycosyltransferase involved in cell wall biosynthesis/ribosomal protein S18 acetylase RimI-like enzyme